MNGDKISIAKTAVLAMDYQAMLVGGAVQDSSQTLARVSEVLSQSRGAGLPIIYVTVGFRPGYPEVSDNNMIFSAVRDGQRFQIGDEGSQIPPEIQPERDDVVLVKHRISAFEGTDLAMLLRARGIDTLIMFGITTSGVILSTVRQAADLDYRMIVLEDLCHDFDEGVHRFLFENILPRQATTMQSDEYVQMLLQ